MIQSIYECVCCRNHRRSTMCTIDGDETSMQFSRHVKIHPWFTPSLIWPQLQLPELNKYIALPESFLLYFKWKSKPNIHSRRINVTILYHSMGIVSLNIAARLSHFSARYFVGSIFGFGVYSGIIASGIWNTRNQNTENSGHLWTCVVCINTLRDQYNTHTKSSFKLNFAWRNSLNIRMSVICLLRNYYA